MRERKKAKKQMCVLTSYRTLLNQTFLSKAKAVVPNAISALNLFLFILSKVRSLKMQHYIENACVYRM